MKEQDPISLTELLAQSAERIMGRLMQDLSEKGGPFYQRVAPEVLERRVQRLFDAFWQGISQHSSKPLTDYIWTASRERGHEGMTVAELRTVGLCLRDALLEVVDEAYGNDPELHLRNSRQIEELILSGIGASVEGFVDGREALISRQYEALRRNQKVKSGHPVDASEN
jgi:hypothetical protein